MTDRDEVHEVARNRRWRRALRWLALSGVLGAVSCAAEPELDGRVSELRRRAEDCPPYAVGTLRFSLPTSSGRVLPVQLWYPADESARAAADRGRPLSEIEPEGPRRALLEQLLQTANDPGTTRVLHAADAPPPFAATEPFPLIIFSHCTDCVRYETLTVAEHLAAQGFAVAAPDHVANTLYDHLEGTSVGLDIAGFLPTRVADLTAVLDTLIDSSASAVPELVRGRFDGTRVGAFGHSFGGITTGLLVQRDERVLAGVSIAAPIAMTPEMQLLAPNAQLADLTAMTKPFMFVQAAEDLAVFTTAIDHNYQGYPAEAWRVTLRDTSHYSFTDICGITPEYDLGSCSPAPRQTDPAATYQPLDSLRARELTKEYVAAFFRQELLGEGRGPRSVKRRRDATVEHKR